MHFRIFWYACKDQHADQGFIGSKKGRYGGIFRTYIVLLFISCARHFLFRRWFFVFYYLVHTTFFFVGHFFSFFTISCSRLFFSITLLYISKGALYTRKYINKWFARDSRKETTTYKIKKKSCARDNRKEKTIYEIKKSCARDK